MPQFNTHLERAIWSHVQRKSSGWCPFHFSHTNNSTSTSREGANSYQRYKCPSYHNMCFFDVPIMQAFSYQKAARDMRPYKTTSVGHLINQRPHAVDKYTDMIISYVSFCQGEWIPTKSPALTGLEAKWNSRKQALEWCLRKLFSLSSVFKSWQYSCQWPGV